METCSQMVVCFRFHIICWQIDKLLFVVVALLELDRISHCCCNQVFSPFPFHSLSYLFLSFVFLFSPFSFGPHPRLGLERGATAKEALDVIVSLLEEHGQGGNYYEDGSSCHSFHSAYLIVDKKEAWVLETVGKYWAAEKITGLFQWLILNNYSCGSDTVHFPWW